MRNYKPKLVYYVIPQTNAANCSFIPLVFYKSIGCFYWMVQIYLSCVYGNVK